MELILTQIGDDSYDKDMLNPINRVNQSNYSKSVFNFFTFPIITIIFNLRPPSSSLNQNISLKHLKSNRYQDDAKYFSKGIGHRITEFFGQKIGKI